ncbi:MAG: DegV family protein [Candidatus Promineifilaceae bacterium]|nr:DegV family protein [Candidatus Promineifilaceae bacterium]
MTIGIVTDSTCDLPDETARAHQITVVPAYINIGEDSYLDGPELTRAEFYRQLPDLEVQPSTAAPAPGAFTAAYEKLAAAGVRQILSIHVASSLSAMLNAARLGAEAAPQVEVTLFDSQQVTMGLGLQCLVAARLAQAGHSMAEIVARLDQIVDHTYVFAALDTLEYLRRSGRVNWAEFGIGTLLRIKPLIRVHRGQVEILEKIRTSSKVRKRLVELVDQLSPLEEVAVLHIRGGEALPSFQAQAQTLFPTAIHPLAVEVTPAVGAHVGPGGLGLACIAAQE